MLSPAPADPLPPPAAEPVGGDLVMLMSGLMIFNLHLGKGGYWEDRGDYAWYAGT